MERKERKELKERKEKKLIRYNVLISSTVPNPARFTRSIFVPFEPTEVKVKQVGYYKTAATNNLWYLKCPTLSQKGTDILCSFVDPTIGYPGVTHQLGRSINGVHQFEVYDYNNNVTTLGGTLMVHLEFRKWI